MIAQLLSQQYHPRPPPLVSTAAQIMRARRLEEHGRTTARLQRAEFMEHMRENRMSELTAWQVQERKLRQARAAIGRKCQTWAKEIAKAHKAAQDEDSWSVLEETGELEVIPDYGQAIEEQALE